MEMTITEKIMAAHAGVSEVSPGQLINAKLDLILGNDITAPIAIRELERLGVKRLFDPDKIVLIPDHFTPNKDIKSAEQCQILRQFARSHQLRHYYEVGRAGIEHAFLPEQGMVLPGDAIIGADSHTCTYGALGAFATGVGSTDLAAAMISGEAWFKVPESIKFMFSGKLRRWVGGKDLILYTIGKIGVDGALYKSMEFCGEVIDRLPMEDRLTMANMAVEAGAKCGIFAPDEITLDYIKGRSSRPYKLFQSEPGAHYAETFEWKGQDIEPQVALPHLPDRVKPISEVGEVAIDQVVIGSCTNGRISDLRIAAQILEGRKVAPFLRLIIIPATQSIYRQALKEGLLDIFLEAEGLVSAPTCGPCMGGHMGVLAAGERAVSTTNRNFVGRMGHPKSEVYLTGPAVAAASAILGRIASPEEVLA
ncbi:MAG TPA: 3-isopropylmalate dehydratase large subunit [Candidatus Methylomirabilis sp.]|jgi:3-isopropylmalate/(R)-2-methylmalate dehydratase large subunit